MDSRRIISDPVSGPTVLSAPELTITPEQYDDLARSVAPLKGRVSKNPKTAAVILAGGTGDRFGAPGGKQMVELLGKPLLTWSAEAFDATPDVGLIVVVCPDSRIEEYCRLAIDPYPFVTPITFASAGQLRQESSFAGVMKVPDDYAFIVVHDGARPLVSPELITHVISSVKGNTDVDGAVVGHPAIDTLKVVNDRIIVGTPDRSAFWIAQTPQVFRAEVIRNAHTLALAEGYIGTDDSSLVERAGGTMCFVQGPRDNIKVTVPEDFGPVEAALASRLKNRSES